MAAGAPKIELRLSEVNPPAPDPVKTIYRDIVNLPDPTQLGITIRYFNYDDVGLYFRVTAEATGYTFGTVDLGLLASGANAYRNLDNFGSRARPAGELTETIKMILRAYTDAAYSNLKWTFMRYVTVIWINSLDPSYTVDVLDNFDDGTVQGWAARCVPSDALRCAIGYPTVGVATDYVLSTPYSLRYHQYATGAWSSVVIGELYKSFTTPNRNKVYAIIDLRWHQWGTTPWMKYIMVWYDNTVLVFLGRPWDMVFEAYVPSDKWVRIVVPLPKNTTFELKIQNAFNRGDGATIPQQYMWMDDFKIISK